MKNLYEITNDNFEREVTKSPIPVMLDFFATWCAPCKYIAPFIEKMAAELDGRIKFGKVDVDQTPELAAQFGISGVPTLIMFRDGKRVDQMVGGASEKSLRGWVEKAAQLQPVSGQ